MSFEHSREVGSGPLWTFDKPEDWAAINTGILRDSRLQNRIYIQLYAYSEELEEA